ncbi:MAG TPA: alpha/beta fold hydrolase [Nocardioidaceae bacterium]|nr:alpha/beta fold hydrolase [Nocardioidaceae bacterium]
MTITNHIRAGALDLYVEQYGEGPDVLLIGGLGDPIESWQHQIDGLCDRYRITAHDNRGMGRSPLPDGPLTIPSMAADAADVLRSLDIGSAHVVGFSGGSVIAQELALRHPGLVRSLVLMSTWARPDNYWKAMTRSWRWMVASAPDERTFLESFFVWVYTHRAHEDGTVAQIVEETLAFPHKASVEAIQRTIDALAVHETADRLHTLDTPTLVLAGGDDLITPPVYGHQVADLVPGARFEVLAGEAHQPFQEVPAAFNARVDEFWCEVDSRRRSVETP